MQETQYTISFSQLFPTKFRINLLLSFFVFLLLANLTTITRWTGSVIITDQIVSIPEINMTHLEPILASEVPQMDNLPRHVEKPPELPKQASAANSELSSNEYKAFIYQKESGNNPAAVNSRGCRGLGQACPGSKLPCGNDYACQDAWFTNYAMTRYGSWEAAYNYWVKNHWW